MRAYALDEFGQAGNVRDLPTPEPGKGEVLIEVRAAGINPMDNVVTQGWVKDMLEHRFPLIPGIDASGVVQAVGEGVSGWAVGDQVFGGLGKMHFGEGTLADATTMSAGSIARRPDALDPVLAAALPLASGTALSFMDALDPQPGQTILVIGAAGGVGSFLVQLLAQRGVQVVGVCRAVNKDYVRGLGAADVIDYEAEDLGAAVRARYPDGIDAIVDLVGDKEVVTRLSDQVHSGGRVASASMGVDIDEMTKRGLIGTDVMGQVTTERLDTIAGALAAGTLKPPQVATVPLEKAGDAIAQVGGRHVRGKLVVTTA